MSQHECAIERWAWTLTMGMRARGGCGSSQLPCKRHTTPLELVKIWGDQDKSLIHNGSSTGNFCKGRNKVHFQKVPQVTAGNVEVSVQLPFMRFRTLWHFGKGLVFILVWNTSPLNHLGCCKEGNPRVGSLADHAFFPDWCQILFFFENNKELLSFASCGMRCKK